MDGSIVVQTWSCWAVSSAVIPFPPNIGLSNSSRIALKSKVSAFLVWSQSASQRGREGKASFLLWDSKFCLHLVTIACWHWKNQLGVKEHMEVLKRKPEGAGKEMHYPALQNLSVCAFRVSFPNSDRFNGSLSMSEEWAPFIVYTEVSR